MADYETLIVPFWLLYVAFIVAGKSCVQPSISFLTFFKCTLFLAVLAATGAVGNTTNLTPHDGWNNVAEPYLIGTFALGGVVNTMPVTYASLPLHVTVTSSRLRHQAMKANTRMMFRYRAAVCIGVVACWVFNLIWCSNVLRIVPQTYADTNRTSNNTLEYAALHGQISTIPLDNTIRDTPVLL